MTRDEAIHILDNLKPTNVKSSFDAYIVGKALTMAIKALEQINNLEKYMNHLEKIGQYGTLKKIKTALEYEENKPKTDVLDKIRAELETEKVGYPPSADYYKAIMKALQIIDKYRQE